MYPAGGLSPDLLATTFIKDGCGGADTSGDELAGGIGVLLYDVGVDPYF